MEIGKWTKPKRVKDSHRAKDRAKDRATNKYKYNKLKLPVQLFLVFYCFETCFYLLLKLQYSVLN